MTGLSVSLYIRAGREGSSLSIRVIIRAFSDLPAALAIISGAACVRALATSASPLLAPPLNFSCCLPAVSQPIFPADTRQLYTW